MKLTISGAKIVKQQLAGIVFLLPMSRLVAEYFLA